MIDIEGFKRTVNPGGLDVVVGNEKGRQNFAKRAFKRSRRPAAFVFGQIQALYRIEAELRELGAGPALRQAERAGRSRMIVKRQRRVLEHLKARHLPKSALGLAITYALGEWEGLEVCLEEGRVEINPAAAGPSGRRRWGRRTGCS